MLLDFVDCKIDVYMHLHTIASTVCLQGNLKTVGYVNSIYKYMYIYIHTCDMYIYIL